MERDYVLLVAIAMALVSKSSKPLWLGLFVYAVFWLHENKIITVNTESPPRQQPTPSELNVYRVAPKAATAATYSEDAPKAVTQEQPSLSWEQSQERELEKLRNNQKQCNVNPRRDNFPVLNTDQFYVTSVFDPDKLSSKERRKRRNDILQSHEIDMDHERLDRPVVVVAPHANPMVNE